MASTGTPCGGCKLYWPISNGVDQKSREPKVGHHGWCTPRSVFPPKRDGEPDFPEDARRAEEGRGSPFIVRAKQVMTGCPHFIAKVDG